MHYPAEDIPVSIESAEMTLRETEFEDMNVGYETFTDHVETDEFFADLPDGRCQSPHWGYVIAGEMTVRYAEDDEVVTAGEVYYLRPGHNITVEAGTTLVEFSPTEQYMETIAVASDATEGEAEAP